MIAKQNKYSSFMSFRKNTCKLSYKTVDFTGFIDPIFDLRQPFAESGIRTRAKSFYTASGVI